MAANAGWSCTRPAFDKLKILLSCTICNQLMKDPFFLDTCGHSFCRSCINTVVSNSCPKCLLPFWIKNLLPNIEFVALLQHLEILSSHLGTPPVTSHDASLYSVNLKRMCLKRNKRRPHCSQLKRINLDPLIDRPLRSNSSIPLSMPSSSRLIPNPGLVPNPGLIPNPKSSECVVKRNSLGETPLHGAAIKGNISEVCKLLKEGADPNIKDNAGWTPLHEACNHGHEVIVEKLLSSGALVNVPGYNNDTPLHDAVRNGRANIVYTLLNAGANVHIRNCQGLTPSQLTINESILSSFDSPFLHNDKTTPTSTITYKRTNVVMLASGLKPYQRSFMNQVCNKLGAKVVKEFTSEVSHVITECDENGCCSRTFKCLLAVTSGCWLVNHQWLVDTVNKQDWVDEHDYIVKGFYYKDVSWITNSPQKGLLNALNKNPGLFNNCNFYFSPADVYLTPLPSKSNLIQLIKLSGGNILTREPKLISENDAIFTPYPFHAEPDSIFSTCHTFIIKPSAAVPIYTTYIATLPCSWLLDCISCFKLVNFTE